MEQKNIPFYQCHKVVQAFQIAALIKPAAMAGMPPGTLFAKNEDATLVAALRGEFIAHHKPEPGGYLVYYPDGYVSYSPQAAFEDGYDLLAPKIGTGEVEKVQEETGSAGAEASALGLGGIQVEKSQEVGPGTVELHPGDVVGAGNQIFNGAVGTEKAPEIPVEIPAPVQAAGDGGDGALPKEALTPPPVVAATEVEDTAKEAPEAAPENAGEVHQDPPASQEETAAQ